MATLTLTEWEQTVADFNGMCAYCLSRPYSVLEHFLPVSEYGTHVNNCLPACASCNKRKKHNVGEDLIRIFGAETFERVKIYLISRGPHFEDICTPRVKKKQSSVEWEPQSIDPSDSYHQLRRVAVYLGISISTLYGKLRALNIKVHRFPLDRFGYLTSESVKVLEAPKRKRLK